MKENKYDDPRFFVQYSKMPRSVDGLKGAGEWHAFRRMLPDFQGKRVLDLGCGYGWHCFYAIEEGANEVTGVDISVRMLEEAKKRNVSDRIRYVCCPVEDFDFPPDAYDVVISSLTLHYLVSFEEICRKVYSTLTPGGSFVFSVEHPVFTAEGSQDWYYNEQGDKLHWPVDRYFAEGSRQTTFLGEAVVKYHKTVTTYVSGLLNAGFQLTGLTEPTPDHTLMQIPGMKDELRRPMMLLLSARKKER